MTAERRQLSVRGLSHSFGRDEVLAGIDFCLYSGEVLALVGPSGCGKTTLLHLAAGLLTVHEGEVRVDFQRTAFMFQQPRLLPWQSTLDNIALGLKAAGMKRAEREHRAHSLALQLGLAHRDLDKFPHQLSGGMQSRVALARALVMEPELLLLDEPFAALDIGLKEELYRLLLDHQHRLGTAVLMITHDLMEAVRLSDAILVMAPAPGRICARFELDLPARARDEAWVYRQTAQFLQAEVVRDCFALPPLAVASGGGDLSSSAGNAAPRPSAGGLRLVSADGATGAGRRGVANGD